MHTNFLIIGAGAVGLTSALELLQAGYHVTLVERGEVGKEASWAGGGILSPLCPWDYPDEVSCLAQRGMALFAGAAKVLQEETGIDVEYQRSGMLVLPPFEDKLASDWCAEHQFPVQSVKLDALLPQSTDIGLLLPEVAQVRNPHLLRALRRRVEILGGVILEQHEVRNFQLQGDRVVTVQTAQGTLSAGAYIITAGAWSKKLLGEYALNIDVRPIRGQILLFKFDEPPFPHILLQQDLYLIPRLDGHVLVGSTLEDVGFDSSTTTRARADLLQRVRDIFPMWKNIEPIQHWAGLRPGSPNNIPTIGQHPEITNLYANFGHFRYGVTMSLASAELLRNVIEMKPQPFSVEPYQWQ
jgi:glycine oxidase